MRDSANTHPNPRLTCRGWSFDRLISRGFKPIPRVSILDSPENLMKTIAEHETKGIPLIIQDIQKHPKWSDQDFSPEWLLEHGSQELHVRNVHNSEDSSLPLPEFMDKCRKIEPFTQPEEQERFYGKDAPCPVQWNEWLHRSGVIPRRLLPDSPLNSLNYLEEQGTVEHLMCYFGIGDTYTPSHKDLCASSGHNLMAYTEHDGGSFWFMTESGDSRKVTDFFASFDQILDHETHVLSAEQAAKAPLPLYVAEQKLGDLVLVPPRSCHQVVNHGGITIKVSWSRMTLMGLQVALYHELPLYRRVCRRETYKVKWTIYHTVKKLTNDLKSNKDLQKPERIVKSLALAVQLFDHTLHEEYAPDHKSMDTLSSPVANLTCDFCGADIFQSFFHCGNCVDEPSANTADGFLLCPGCYVEGRTCRCRDLEPVQFQPFEKLLDARRAAHSVLISFWNRHKGFKSVPLTSESDLLSTSSRDGIFFMCNLLRASRIRFKGAQRICSGNKKHGESHDARSDACIHCKGCHRTRCFLHLLSYAKTHALQLLQADDADKFHKYHLEARDVYDAGLEQYMKDESTGAKPNVMIQLSNLARTFKTCKPFNPRFCRRGWYDETVLVINVSPTSEGFNLPNAQSPLLPSGLNDGPSQGCKRKRKMFVLDCVSIETTKRSKPRLVTNPNVHDLLGAPELILPRVRAEHSPSFNPSSLSKKPRKGPRPGPSTKTSYGRTLIDTARMSSKRQQQLMSADQPTFVAESSYASDIRRGDHVIIDKGKARGQHSSSYDGPKHQLQSELTTNESNVLEVINHRMNNLQRQVTSLQHQLSDAGPSQPRAPMLSSGTLDAPRLYQISTQLCICTQAIGNLQSLLLPTRQEQGQWGDIISLLKEVVRKIEIRLAQPVISGLFPGLQHHLHPMHGPGPSQDITTTLLNNGHYPNESIWMPPPPEYDPRLDPLNSNMYARANRLVGEGIGQGSSRRRTPSPEFCSDRDHGTDELEGVDQDKPI